MTDRLTLTSAIVFVCLVVTSCGKGGVEGKYVPQGRGLFSSMTFKSGGKVDVEFVGAQQEGTYVVENDAIVLTAPNGDKSRWVIERDGCLTNSVVGHYCKQ